ncbi:TPA: hypothetical protein IAA82_06150 [Candidatus Galligastranaerophilus gallistercoris]|nr:hypothetical protein [Candidatus Galligastranaerophilus gallistercoris]
MQINPISFTQNYISSTWVKNAKTNKNEQMDFVEFEDCPQDKVLLEQTVSRWEKLSPLTYGTEIYEGYRNAVDENDFDKHFYGLTDNNGTIQVLAEINTGDREICFYDPELSNKKPFEILFLSANPKSTANKEKREYKGLGSAMVKELVTLAGKKKKDYIALDDANYSFWHKMPYFKSVKDSPKRILKSEDYQKCTKELDLMI